MVSVVQLSDTHFAHPGHRSHGGLGYDTDAAFEAVLADIEAAGHRPDVFVVTGDVADLGRIEDYGRAADALARLPGPISLVPGNHDLDTPLRVGMAGTAFRLPQLERRGDWLFVYADSNADGRDVDETGRLVDRDSRMEDAKGRLGAREVAWIDEVVATTDAPHVFLWLHHPPNTGLPGFSDADYDAEMDELIGRHERIRGLGAGHVHTDMVAEVAGRPVFVCPALTINIDYDAATLLPPSYRTYEFHADGTIDSETRLMDGDQWPRHPIPPVGMQFLRGEIGFEELIEGLEGMSPTNPGGTG